MPITGALGLMDLYSLDVMQAEGHEMEVLDKVLWVESATGYKVSVG